MLRRPSCSPTPPTSGLTALRLATPWPPCSICVTEHFPEPFLARFIYPHHRNDLVGRHDFPFEGLRVQVRPWRLEDNAEQVYLRQHVRLCVENVPLYLWNNDTAVQQAIGRACSLDYVEEACKNKTYNKALCVWAWVQDPGLVPRVRWVTLPGPSAPPGVHERGRRGLRRRCIMHLDILEDMSIEDRPMPGKFSWRWGHVDGERLMRDQAERLVDDSNSRRRDRRDEDDDRDRHGRRGWRETIRRSLSRGARGRDDGHTSRDQGRQRDRSGNRDGDRSGGRRMASSATSVLLRRAAEQPLPATSAGCSPAMPAPGAQLLPLPGALARTTSPTAVAHAVVEPLLELLLAPAVDATPATPPELGMPRSLGMALPHPVLAPSLDAAADAARVTRAWELLAAPLPRHEVGLARGRARVRSTSPRATRRRSRAARTPPATPGPPSSPTAVCPSSPSSKGSCPPFSIMAH
jgi:hypothetical protein